MFCDFLLNIRFFLHFYAQFLRELIFLESCFYHQTVVAELNLQDRYSTEKATNSIEVLYIKKKLVSLISSFDWLFYPISLITFNIRTMILRE